MMFLTCRVPDMLPQDGGTESSQVESCARSASQDIGHL
jgi:hypothetical protein